MKITFEAEWKKDDGPFADISKDEILEIAGMKAIVYDRGDVWAFDLHASGSRVGETVLIDSAWADDSDGAKKAAEAAILKHFKLPVGNI